jgi:hypothetical protein
MTAGLRRLVEVVKLSSIYFNNIIHTILTIDIGKEHAGGVVDGGLSHSEAADQVPIRILNIQEKFVLCSSEWGELAQPSGSIKRIPW